MKTKTQSYDHEESKIETFDDVFDAIYEQDPGKAAAMKLRSDMLMRLRRTVDTWSGTQREKAERLQITQPRFSLLMTSADTKRFALDDLVSLSARAGDIPRLQYDRPAKTARRVVSAVIKVADSTAVKKVYTGNAKAAVKLAKPAQRRHAGTA